ncbi:Bacteroidetes-Associated Carbohydrate-binding Often N-terminal [Porphyromonas macacae]|uniref:Bacteroidetes-Associated Carbohydrate-binding Often N-terminal n=1 Tax=Porphyromonas macacae TaxID=28115 RepID=A0A379DKF4_9PORP|nr:BACON domain-containing protein [Porphyromonas macacae]SUB78642.1 Bacteroidetes-Associated Carbohydrate-binding Often N-terminal [Porphyromonas macacae]
MNKAIILGLSLILMMLSSCVEPKPGILEVSPNKLSFGGTEESLSVTVKCSSNDWTWESDFPKWISIQRKDDGAVTITARPNPESHVREGRITFICEDLKSIVSIEQAPKPVEYYIQVVDQLELDDVHAPVTIEVKTNAPAWEIVSKPQWLEVSQKDQQLIITAGPNTGSNRREGLVTLEAEGKQALLKVTQAEKAYVSISKELSIFHYLGGVQTISFKSNRKDIVIDYSDFSAHFTSEVIGDNQLRISAPRNIQNKEINRSISFIYKGRTLLDIKVNQEKSNIEADQRAYLVEFFKMTNGENWVNNTNWLSDRPLSEWYGIRMGDEGYGVYSIILKDNNLSGRIPKGFGILVSANLIKLQGNALEGELPGELTNLKEVVILDLSNNNFTGSIPAGLCGDFPKRISLDLRGNRLSGTVPTCFIENVNKYKFCPQQEGYKFDNYHCN